MSEIKKNKYISNQFEFNDCSREQFFTIERHEKFLKFLAQYFTVQRQQYIGLNQYVVKKDDQSITLIFRNDYVQYVFTDRKNQKLQDIVKVCEYIVKTVYNYNQEIFNIDVNNYMITSQRVNFVNRQLRITRLVSFSDINKGVC